MKALVPRHFCPRGTGHNQAIYNPKIHKTELCCIRPVQWQAMEKEKKRDQDDWICWMLWFVIYLGLWTLITAGVVGESNYGLISLLVYLVMGIHAILLYSLRILFSERFSLTEEWRHGWPRLLFVSLLWPIYIWFWPNEGNPIGLLQQLKLEAAWRQRYRIIRPLTNEERRHLEQLWTQGYKEALADLLGSDRLQTAPAPLLLYGLIAVFWLIVMPNWAKAETKDNQIGLANKEVICGDHTTPLPRDGPILNQHQDDSPPDNWPVALPTWPVELPLVISWQVLTTEMKQLPGGLSGRIDHIPKLLAA